MNLDPLLKHIHPLLKLAIGLIPETSIQRNLLF